MKECICPIIVITCTKDNHVSEIDMRTIAQLTMSMVKKVVTDGRSINTLFGPHRDDCPCK